MDTQENMGEGSIGGLSDETRTTEGLGKEAVPPLWIGPDEWSK